MGKVKFLEIVALLAAFGLASFAFTSRYPSHDWQTVYLPATRNWVLGSNPYVPLFANPPWLLPLLTPFLLMPERLASSAMSVASAIVFVYFCYRFQVGIVGTLLFLGSCTAFTAYFNGNVEPILLLGAFLPPIVGLPLLAIKPQISIGYLIYQAWDALRNGTFIETFAPLFALTVMALPYIPVMFLNAQDMMGRWWNASLWPFGFPVGVAILIYAIFKKRPILALASSVLLTPYAPLYSYMSIQIAIMAYGGKDRTRLLAVCFVVSWLVQFLRT